MPGALFPRALGVALLPDGAPGYMEFDQLLRTQTPMVSLLYSLVNEESRGLSIRYFGFRLTLHCGGTCSGSWQQRCITA